MDRKAVCGIILTLLLTCMLTLAFNIQQAKAEPKTWIVDDDGPTDFHTIQEATNDGMLIGAYYYVWWGMHVNPHWPLGYKYTPILGEYDSGNPEVADQHILWAVKHGVDFFAVSWFGSHAWADYPYIDQNLRNGLLKASYLPYINFCIFYESVAIMDRAESLGANKTQVFIEDIMYVASNYFSNPSYLKIDGKPVVFLYALHYLYQKLNYTTSPFEFIRQQLASMNMSIYFVGDAVTPSTPDVNSPLLRSMNAVTSYFFKFATDWEAVLNDIEIYYPQWLSAMNSIGVNFIPNIYSGFDDTAFIYGANRVLPRNQSIFRRMLDIASTYLDPHIKTLIITSWNEWHESTSIEPAIEWEETYLQKLHIINVPADYSTIQEAINAASPGDTIFVYNGTYYENVIVNKTISLIGEDRETTIIDGNRITPGAVVTVTADNVTVSNFTIQNGGGSPEDAGIRLDGSEGSIIINNSIRNNVRSIDLMYSVSNVISGNTISDAGYCGVALRYSHNNTIIGNVIVSNVLQIHGFQLWESNSNTLSNNIVHGSGTDYGISLTYSNHNNITINLFLSSEVGINLAADSNYNKIIGNNITLSSKYGILAGAGGNVIYHNNFINNVRQVWTESLNVWDDGYPSGGNYWSDYTGVDLYSGPYQNETGSDGIGDTPYSIDENNTDRYPLMNPWGTGTPIANFSWSPTTPEVNELVTFNASASMPIGGEIVSYKWDFGDGNYASGKIVTHRYSTAGTFTVTLNVTDSEGLWDIEQKQIEVKAPPPPLTVSISPTSASILVGESVTFTSTVSGGYTPYSYQWYLNGNPVSGATSDAWTFTPTESGIFYVYLKVTDDEGNTAQSETARITVSAVPVGGYSIPINVPTTTTKPITPYIALLAILTAIFTTIKRKTKKKAKM